MGKTQLFFKKLTQCLCLCMIMIAVVISAEQAAAETLDYEAYFSMLAADPDYQPTVNFLVEVFKTMQQNYYQPVSSDDFKKFIVTFNMALFPEMKASQKSSLYIKWRSAAHLVEALRANDDIFSMFFPPQDAAQYETTALGKRMDLGIDGQLTDDGYEVTWVEPRSDAHDQGLSARDVVTQIAGQRARDLTIDRIREILTPLEGDRVELVYRDHLTANEKTITLVSREYFKQLAFLVPTGIDGIFCIQIQRFNRATAEDVSAYIQEISEYPGEAGLIIDLRGNPGGPPLAAREISGFFLEPGDAFAYFQKRGYPKAELDVPELPEPYRFRGDIVILIDEESGSAAELFSGVLQRKNRAQLMGMNSAGQVFLKSMFYLDDQSMVLLVTARGHHPDGAVFSFDGLTPDIVTDQPDDQLMAYAAQYLVEKRQGRQTTGSGNR